MRRLLLTICVVMLIGLSLRMGLSQNTRGQAVVKIKTEEGILNLYEGSYALVIGASHYTNGWSNLEGVNTDVNKVTTALKEHGFEVEILIDPTREQLDQMMRKFISRYGIKEGNRIVVYYAGHGYTEKNNGSNLGYIVPVDAPLPKKDLGGFIEKAISMSEIENYARQIRSKHALFVFDSCFSGTLFEPRSRAVPPIISSKTSRPVRQFITAGTAEQEVPDNSVFCQQFVEGLKGEADLDGNNFITGNELGAFLETQVTNYSNRSQTPRYGTIRDPNLDKGDFVFALVDTKVVGITKPKPKMEIEREVPVGTLVITANRKDMEILLDKEVVAKSKAVGEKITIKNMEAGKIIEIIGRVGGEKDVVEQIELVAGVKTEMSLGKTIVSSNPSESANTVGASTNGSSIPVASYRPVGKAVAPMMRSYNYETVTIDDKGYVKNRENKQASFYEEGLGKGVKLEMVEIAGGTFMMGSLETEASTYGDEYPQHQVKIEGFYIGKYEVTQGQWKAIMGSNPSDFKGDDNLPVENVSWEKAKEFCKKLSEKIGREYRLPSEAEWEYAARGGTKTVFGLGETITPDVVNYNGDYSYGTATKGEYRKKTVKVGSLRIANGYGIYDMHGNVLEWCEDGWHDSYKGAPTDGSAWESGADNSGRVLRGGSWNNNANVCRSAFRSRNAPGILINYIGFRVVVGAARTLR